MIRSTSKWMAVSTRARPGSRLKTVRTSSSLAPQFFTREITQRRSANCAANETNGGSSSLMYFGRFGRHHRLCFFGRFSHHFVSLRDAHNFFDSRSALGDASPTVLPQGLHTFDNRTLLQLAAITFSHDQLSQRLSNEANLINRRATLIAGLAALIATSAAPEARAEFLHRKTDLNQIVARIIHQLHAVGTNRAHEPLRYERLHHR